MSMLVCVGRPFLHFFSVWFFFSFCSAVAVSVNLFSEMQLPFAIGIQCWFSVGKKERASEKRARNLNKRYKYDLANGRRKKTHGRMQIIYSMAK